jgi:hypothetical protein
MKNDELWQHWHFASMVLEHPTHMGDFALYWFIPSQGLHRYPARRYSQLQQRFMEALPSLAYGHGIQLRHMYRPMIGLVSHALLNGLYVTIGAPTH